MASLTKNILFHHWIRWHNGLLDLQFPNSLPLIYLLLLLYILDQTTLAGGWCTCYFASYGVYFFLFFHFFILYVRLFIYINATYILLQTFHCMLTYSIRRISMYLIWAIRFILLFIFLIIFAPLNQDTMTLYQQLHAQCYLKLSQKRFIGFREFPSR